MSTTRVIALLFVTSTFCSGQTLHSYTSDGYTLYYEQYGSGPAMYILSGGPGEYPGETYHQLSRCWSY